MHSCPSKCGRHRPSGRAPPPASRPVRPRQPVRRIPPPISCKCLVLRGERVVLHRSTPVCSEHTPRFSREPPMLPEHPCRLTRAGDATAASRIDTRKRPPVHATIPIRIRPIPTAQAPLGLNRYVTTAFHSHRLNFSLESPLDGGAGSPSQLTAARCRYRPGARLSYTPMRFQRHGTPRACRSELMLWRHRATALNLRYFSTA